MENGFAYKEQYKALKKEDESKDSLIEKLIAYCDELKDELGEVTSDLKREKKMARLTQKEVEDKDKELGATLRKIDKHAFVMVLLDGDCMIFKDEFVKAAEIGGQDAAGSLSRAIEASLQSKKSKDMPANYRVVVHIYVNLLGLSSAYRRYSILRDPGAFESFVRGFNKTYPGFEIVDAGNDKECADVKIKEKLEMAVSDVHCRHIIFGGSGDNGYIRQLTPYSIDEAVRERITLVTGARVSRGFNELSERMRTERFEAVFRSEALDAPHNHATGSGMAKASPTMRNSLILSGSGADTAVSSATNGKISPTEKDGQTDTWALKAASTNGAKPLAIRPTYVKTKLLQMHQNAAGERIDIPLRYPTTLATEMRNERYCNDFHLRSGCTLGRDQCSYTHEPELNQEKKAALRSIARTSPCGNGVGCEDFDCVLGHSCLARPCRWGKACRFPVSMHDVDQTIARSTTEDGRVIK